jgi:16S rRNA processing protein RimM
LTDRLAIATVGRSHGVKGYFRVTTFSGEIEHLENLRLVILKKGAREKEYEIEHVRLTGGGAMLKLVGVDSPEDAKTLVGAVIWADREYGAPLQEDEYYAADLVGCRVIRGQEDVGVVSAILEGGGGDLLEVRRPGGETFLVPFRQEFVKEVLTSVRKVELVEDSVIR